MPLLNWPRVGEVARYRGVYDPASDWWFGELWVSVFPWMGLLASAVVAVFPLVGCWMGWWDAVVVGVFMTVATIVFGITLTGMENWVPIMPQGIPCPPEFDRSKKVRIEFEAIVGPRRRIRRGEEMDQSDRHVQITQILTCRNV
jgi:hypothetical protein